jgi:hypothetical protein
MKEVLRRMKFYDSLKQNYNFFNESIKDIYEEENIKRNIFFKENQTFFEKIKNDEKSKVL